MSFDLPEGSDFSRDVEFIVGEDCMGQREIYWRQWVMFDSGEFVCGCAGTAEEAVARAIDNAQEHVKG